jgi:hypothetical protein
MDTEFESLTDKYLDSIYKYRAKYLGARERFRLLNRGDVNVAEFTVLITRGGDRIPIWLRQLNHKEMHLQFPLHEISKGDLLARYQETRSSLYRHKIVPKTKNRLFAAYLSGELCPTAASLSRFAGIARSTAHIWLHRCAQYKLLDEFETEREIYYLNAPLIQIALVGSSSKSSLFLQDYFRDLANLRQRKHSWLATSKLVVRFGGDLRRYEA